MNTEDDPQTETEQQAIEAAWDGRYNFLGKRLPEWSDNREMTAQTMGMKCPSFSAPDIDRIRLGEPYAGMLRDMAIFFWLLSIRPQSELTKEERKDPNVWSLENADALPGAALDAAKAYAHEHKFSSAKVGSPQAANYLEARTVFWAVFNGIEASKFVLESDAEPEDSGSREKKV